MFERLDKVGIEIELTDCFYPYFAVFDIECCLPPSSQVASENVTYSTEHQLASAAVHSYVPLYDVERCFTSSAHLVTAGL